MQVLERCNQNPIRHIRWSFSRKIVNGFQSLPIFTKNSILDVWQGSELLDTSVFEPFSNTAE